MLALGSMASRNPWRRKPSADVTAGARSRRRSWLPPGPQPRRRQVIVLGMTRSGTSLTTAIVAGLLGGSTRPAATWCGSARPYPKDQRTTAAGYFERQVCAQLAARCPALPEPHTPHATPAQDVVSLNYWVLKELGHPWTKFSAGFASRPTLLAWGAKNESASRRRFERRASRVVDDMSSHAPGDARAWVLKDARFARTLPLWWPMLSQPLCIIPYRHPAEVASSSILVRVRVRVRVRFRHPSQPRCEVGT